MSTLFQTALDGPLNLFRIHLDIKAYYKSPYLAIDWL